SDALALYLAERFGDDRGPIAALGHREPEMLIAFLGSVKSGRPYVPIDTVFPRQRIDKIVAISRAAMVLTPQETAQFSATQPRPCGQAESALSHAGQLQRDHMGFHAVLCTDVSGGGEIWRGNASSRPPLSLLR